MVKKYSANIKIDCMKRDDYEAMSGRFSNNLNEDGYRVGYYDSTGMVEIHCEWLSYDQFHETFKEI